MSTKLLKIISAATFGIGSFFVFNRVGQINNLLGNQLLDASQRIFRQDAEEQKQMQMNKNDLLGSLKWRISVQCTVLEEKMRVYTDRLINFGLYQDANSALIKQVINPILLNYEKEKVFQLEEIIKEFQTEGNFNNKLTELLLNIVAKNDKLKQQKKGYLQDVSDLQDQLMTYRLLNLSQNQKNKIDILYNYLRKKDETLQKIFQNEPESKVEIGEVPSQDYLSKIQLL